MGDLIVNTIRRAEFADRWYGVMPARYYVEKWHSPRLVHRLMRVFLG